MRNGHNNLQPWERIAWQEYWNSRKREWEVWAKSHRHGDLIWFLDPMRILCEFVAGVSFYSNHLNSTPVRWIQVFFCISNPA